MARPELPATLATLRVPRPKRRRLGLLVSILLHLALVGLVIWEPGREWLRTLGPGTPGAPMGGGGGGGGGPRYISLPALRPPLAPSRPEVAPVVPPPLVVVVPTDPDPVTLVPPDTTRLEPVGPPGVTTGTGTGVGPGEGGGSGGGTGGGVGTGTGSGTGPGTGGEGGLGRPPESRQVILPPLDTPKAIRGQTFKVTFWVGADGRVDRLAIEPDIPDRDYDRKFREIMRNYRFRPARSPEGLPVAGITTIGITLGTK